MPSRSRDDTFRARWARAGRRGVGPSTVFTARWWAPSRPVLELDRLGVPVLPMRETWKYRVASFSRSWSFLQRPEHADGEGGEPERDDDATDSDEQPVLPPVLEHVRASSPLVRLAHGRVRTRWLAGL
jgi:hypothetical protein